MNVRIALHVGFWLLYLLISSYITADLGNVSYREFSWLFRLGIAMAEKVGFVFIQAAIFYWLFYNFIPGFKKVNVSSILQFILGILISILAYRIWVSYFVYPIVYDETYPGETFAPSLMFFSFLRIYSFVGIAGAIKMFRGKQHQKEREQQLIKEKLESELHFLRAQINPHFFFNTLNNIYGLARKQSDQTADVVMKLSKLMRFILYECTSDSIPIFQEIKVLEDYIALEKIRYDDRLTINFSKKIDDAHQQIAPLLLLPFVENSFKHGASEMRFDTRIDLDILLEKKLLTFRICNMKDASNKSDGKGLGLQNVKRQLELLYPNNYELSIDDAGDKFTVVLKLNLN